MRGQATRYTSEAAAAGRKAKDERYRARLNAFAEAVAEYGDVPTASRAIGVPGSTGRDYMKALREALGRQAQ